MQGSISGLDKRLDMDSILDPHSTLRERVRKILDRGLANWKSEKSRGAMEAFSSGIYSALIGDVGRYALGGPSIRWYDPEDLDEYLCKPRRVEKSRKRFQSVVMIKNSFVIRLTRESYLKPLRVEPALILYLATPISDRRYIAHFYFRHSSFLSYFHEYVRPRFCRYLRTKLIKPSHLDP